MFDVHPVTGGLAVPRDDRAPLATLRQRWLLLAAISGGVSWACQLLDVSLFGYSQLTLLRTWFTLFFILHLVACLFSYDRRDEVLMLVITPFLAQFYQACLGRDAPPGALSLPRLLPYLVLAAAFMIALWRREYRPTRSERLLCGLVLGLSVTGWIIGSRFSMAGITISFFMGVLLPLFSFYIGSIAQRRPEFLAQFPAAVTIGIFVLMFGFLATFLLGTTVETFRGEGSIESAREVGDFNSLIPYLLLAWPFAVSYLRERHSALVLLLFVLFLVVAFAGLSKTMMVIAPPLILLSLPAALPRIRPRTIVFGMILAVAVLFLLVQLVASSEAGLFILDLWIGRLDIDRNALDNLSFADVAGQVSTGSEAWDDRAVLREEALRIFFDHPLLGSGWATYPFLSRIEQGTSHALTTDLLQQCGVIGALLFWFVALEIGARLIALVRERTESRRVALLFPASFGLWLLAAHTVGAQLFIAANSGFTVNAITGMLFVMYLRRESLAACWPRRAPA